MKCMLFLLAIFILVDQDVLAQTCYTSLRCTGGTTSGATFDGCCGPVVQDNTLARSFRSGSTCSPCYVIGLDQASYTLTESYIVHRIRLRVLSPADPAGFFNGGRPKLRLKGIPGTTTSEDDFLLPSSDILIRSFSGLDVSVTLFVDGIAGEQNENFVITSQPPIEPGSGDAKFLFRTTTINIGDANKATYEFLLTEYAQFEGSDSTCNRVTVMQTTSRVESDIHLLVTPLTYAQYIARSTNDPSLQPINTYHGIRPQAATFNPSGKQDFMNIANRVTFPAGSEEGATSFVNIEVLDDDIDENPEGFILVLDVDTSQTGIGVSFTSSKRTALVNIYDNDPFFFGFEQQVYIYNERSDEGFQEIPFSAAPGNETEKTFYFALDLTSIEGAFLFGRSGDLNFGINNRPVYSYVSHEGIITFGVNNDNTAEGEEIGQLRIAPNTAFDGSAAPRFQSVRIVIVDDDAAILTLSAPSTVQENTGSFSATISLTLPTNTGLASALHVDVLDTEISATKSADYTSTTRTVVFQGSSRTLTVSYSVSDDSIAEPNEILSLTIQRSTISAQIPVSYRTQSVDVTIIDNDVARIGFESTSINVFEGSSATLGVAVLGNTVLGRDVIVNFSTADGTATDGVDYTNTVIELTFNATATRYDVMIPIIQDGITETLESFRAGLQVMKNSYNIRLTVDPVTAVVNIIRNNT